MGSQQSYQVDGIPVSWHAFKKQCKEDNIDTLRYKPQYRGNPKEKPIFNCENKKVWKMN